uniref:Uncharacterized protein n=1 Tax=Cynoglossus semilaevis TaxID=244447 RepID=A0A3P8X1C7_CYNSE
MNWGTVRKETDTPPVGKERNYDYYLILYLILNKYKEMSCGVGPYDLSGLFFFFLLSCRLSYVAVL